MQNALLEQHVRALLPFIEDRIRYIERVCQDLRRPISRVQAINDFEVESFRDEFVRERRAYSQRLGLEPEAMNTIWRACLQRLRQRTLN